MYSIINYGAMIADRARIRNEARIVFDTNDQAVQALKNGQIDGIVVDLPTAYFMTAVQLDDGVIVGQLPLPEGETEQFGMLFEEGNPLRDCINEALASIDLDAIQQEWLSDVVDAPIIETG